MLKIYLASSWKNQYYESVLKTIQEMNKFYVYDFRKQNTAFNWNEIDDNWESWTTQQFLDALKHPLSKRAYTDDFSHLRDCDICIMITPCGRSSHLEGGYAVGHGSKLIVCLTEDQRPELTYKMASIVTSIDELITILRLLS